MKTIHADELAPGMILAEDVLGPDGRRLLSANTLLAAEHLRMFQAWGVTEANIFGDAVEPVAPEDAFPPEILDEARVRTEAVFDTCGSTHEMLIELQRQCVLHRARTLLENHEPHRVRQCPLIRPHPRPLPSLDAFLDEADIFVSFPETFFRILEVLDDPDSTAGHLADVVALDPGMSAKLLRLVNSPFYGFSKPIDNLERAVALVGTRELSQLALGITIIQSFDGVAGERLTTREVWTHSLACGVFARVLASHVQGVAGEGLFVAGILHDTGRLIMLTRLPGIIGEAMRLSLDECTPLYAAERRLLGWDHTDLARRLFQRWNLPQALQEAAAGHHAPMACPQQKAAALLHVADILAIALEYGFNGSSWVPPLAPGAWECLGIPTSVLGPSISAGARQIDDILTLFIS